MLSHPTCLPSPSALHHMFLLQGLRRSTRGGCSRVTTAASQLSTGPSLGGRLGDRASIHTSLASESFLWAPGMGSAGQGYQDGPRDGQQGGFGGGYGGGEGRSGQPAIEAGGGPRTFPGGVTKWQWKRMQDKKAQTVERARLMREREAFEAQRREQLRLINGPERPWEETRTTAPPAVAMPRVPEAVVDRFERPRDAEDLWNENDGPTTYRRADGQISARLLPLNAVYSTAGYERVDGKGAGRGESRGNGAASVAQNGKRSRQAKGGGTRDEVVTPWEQQPMESQLQSKRSHSKKQQQQQQDPPWRSSGGEDAFPVGRAQQVRNPNPRGSGPSFAYGEQRQDRVVRDSQPQGSRTMSVRAGAGQAGSRPRRQAVSLAAEAEEVSEKVPVVSQRTTQPSSGGSGADPSFMSKVRFDSFPLSEGSIRALHDDLGYEICTVVQAETMPAILSGRDVLAKAKTGTGKTIAFLLPALEALLRAEEDRQRGAKARPALTGGPIRTLVICPARELATQVAEEAKQLLRHHPGCGAQLVIGGTRMPAEAARLAKQPCQVLVGTPGRLLDHIQSTHGVRQQLQGLQTLVLDECDQLLDMGFRKTLDGILAALPHQRQTLLFSATLAKEVHAMAKVALRGDHDFIDTVGEETTTNIQVRQEQAIVAMEKQLPAVYALLLQHMAEEPQFKVLVFATTARQTQLMAELFRTLGVRSLEIHSRKSQANRTKVSDEFRQSTGVVMFTSDVSARGVDYPDVTLVVQVGVPSDKAQYIHRLGRTGRAGKEGRGVLLLSPWESFFLKQLSDLPVLEADMPAFNPTVESKVQAALRKVEEDTKEKAYQSWLGYYNSAKGLKWDKATLVRHANMYSATLGLHEPPALMKKTIGMMGLRGVPGLRIK